MKNRVSFLLYKFFILQILSVSNLEVFKWLDSEEFPSDYEISSCLSGSAHSSSSNSAIVSVPAEITPTVDDLLALDGSWGFHNSNTQSNNSNDATTFSALKRGIECDDDDSSDAENNRHAQSATTSSYVPHQLSSWLGRQKLSHWRKKNSTSQSNLPSIISTSSVTGSIIDFSASYNEIPSASSKGW